METLLSGSTPDTQDVINLTEKKISVHTSDVDDSTRYRSTTGQTGLRDLNEEVFQ